MNYFVTALKSEAQAFVDKFKLKKSKLDGFTLFQHELFVLIISGIGIQNATLATQTLLKNFHISNHDIFINIGICGASKKFSIGDLVEMSAIYYQGEFFKVNEYNGYNITCVNEAEFQERYEIVDMESYGFYNALINKNIYIFKVVSDHFEPHTITKEKTKQLLFHSIEKILQRIQQ